MSRRPPDPERLAAIDEAVARWRQGDVFRGKAWVTSVADLGSPLTSESLSAEGAEDGVVVLPAEVDGVVVLTQTCDVVRRCSERPYVQVAPVREVSTDKAALIEKGLSPRYARVPAIVGLIADLDRVTTVEKSVLAEWEHTEGCSTDAERRAFAQALSRKHARFAFPDDLTEAVQPLRARILDKHGRASPEGVALREHLREIRMTADPEWNAPVVSAFITFVRNDTPEAARVAWDQLLERWLSLCVPAGAIFAIDGTVMTLAQMTAQEYVESDPLDLGHLSLRDGET